MTDIKNNKLLYGVIGFLLGAVVMLLVTSNAVNTNNTKLLKTMGINSGPQKHMMKDGEAMDDEEKMMDDEEEDDMSMSGMVEELKGKSADEFDDEFTDLMIEHHMGAVEMSKLAQKYAKHDEITKLATDIITAQNKEIEMMKAWRQTWGYGN